MSRIEVPQGTKVSEETVNRVFKEVQVYGPVSAKAIAQALGVSTTTVYRALEVLRMKQAIQRRWDTSRLRWLYSIKGR